MPEWLDVAISETLILSSRRPICVGIAMIVTYKLGPIGWPSRKGHVFLIPKLLIKCSIKKLHRQLDSRLSPVLQNSLWFSLLCVFVLLRSFLCLNRLQVSFMKGLHDVLLTCLSCNLRIRQCARSKQPRVSCSQSLNHIAVALVFQSDRCRLRGDALTLQLVALIGIVKDLL